MSQSRQTKIPSGLHDPEIQKQIVAKVRESVGKYLAKTREVVKKLHEVMESTFKIAYESIITDLRQRNISARDEDIKKLARQQGLQMYYHIISPIESFLLWTYEDLLKIRQGLDTLCDFFESIDAKDMLKELDMLRLEARKLSIELMKLSHYVTDMYVYDMRPIFELERITPIAPEQASQALDLILGERLRQRR